nr:MAG TPA: hypothetical protein [Caudoviricetes sp.]DAU49677.1 MAG TPA: hypothetical protein [Caudoviricetes sp.]DAZ13107.1 MAG TPA: hypothetical protein [Caudoviricetes sp.]
MNEQCTFILTFFITNDIHIFYYLIVITSFLMMQR